MRIDLIKLQNFKKYAIAELTLHPRFTLLVGENGSGKTTLLDALAVSLGLWLVDPPDRMLLNSGRPILATEIRLVASREGDRTQFREKRPTSVTASGVLDGLETSTWTRQIKEGRHRTSNEDAAESRALIQSLYKLDADGTHVLLPILAYYGAGRAWLPSNARLPREATNGGPARRWAAFYDCFSERIRFDELRHWFHRETTAAGARRGQMRPGFEAVKRAVLRCVPGASDLWFDPDRAQLVLSIGGQAQPFDNLSAGQRMMLAMIADIAIKAVTQNAHLLPPDKLGPDDEPLPRVLQQTPGVVLIDELDVHLHPSWQRRVATDLKSTFPAMQFVCTSHSPQVIGEISREEVRVLEEQGTHLPSVAVGADSNWILDHVMGGAASLNEGARQLRDQAEDALAEGDLTAARGRIDALREIIDGETGELVRLESSLETLERLADSDGAAS